MSFGLRVTELYEKLEGRQIFKYYNLFKSNEYQSFQILKERQVELLKRLVSHSYKTVLYYQEIFQKIGFEPDGLITRDVMKKIPILTRKDLKNNFDNLISSAFNRNNLIEYATGGSTGEPVKFLLTKEQYDMRAAVSFKSYQMAGWDFLNKTIFLTGSPIEISKCGALKSKIKAYLLRQAPFSSFDLTEEKLAELYNTIKRMKPKVVFGYVSALYLFAEYLKKSNLRVSIPIIVQMAELAGPEQIEYIEHQLGGHFYKHYGARDAIAIGMECEKRTGLHVNMDTLFVEILKDNEEVYDEDGEIIITDLYSYGMPLLRYQIGDIGRWLKCGCSCGRQTPLFEITRGRTASIISTIDGKYIDSLYLPHLFKERADKVEKYQAYEPDIHHLIVKVVKRNNYTQKDEQYLKEKLHEKLGNQIAIEFRYVGNIPSEPSGKYLFIKSDVPVDFGNILYH